MLQLGDKVVLNGCPFDEQIVDQVLMYVFLKDQVMTVTRIARPGDSFAPYIEDAKPEQHWVKTNLTDDWIDSYWFKKAE